MNSIFVQHIPSNYSVDALLKLETNKLCGHGKKRHSLIDKMFTGNSGAFSDVQGLTRVYTGRGG